MLFHDMAPSVERVRSEGIGEEMTRGPERKLGNFKS